MSAVPNQQPQSATATTPGIVIPAYIAQLAAHSRLTLSPKVSIPGLIGFSALAICCELQHYGMNLNFGSVALGVVTVMVMLGWIVPDDRAVVAQSVQHAITQNNGGNNA